MVERGGAIDGMGGQGSSQRQLSLFAGVPGIPHVFEMPALELPKDPPGVDLDVISHHVLRELLAGDARIQYEPAHAPGVDLMIDFATKWVDLRKAKASVDYYTNVKARIAHPAAEADAYVAPSAHLPSTAAASSPAGAPSPASSATAAA